MACSSHEPLETAPLVELDRFMGDWFVQGHIPASSEKNAYNGVESYAREGSGKILTSYVFRDGGFDADIEIMEPTGYVLDRETGAEWGMRFAWWFPFKLEYLVAYVDDAYSETIIARTKRDYVWIMTRDAEISDERYAALLERVAAMGYDAADVRRLPQRWPDPGHPVSDADGNLARFTRGK